MNELIEEAIDKLTAMLIKTDFEEKQKGSSIYIKKTAAIKDTIKLLKEIGRIK